MINIYSCLFLYYIRCCGTQYAHTFFILKSLWIVKSCLISSSSTLQLINGYVSVHHDDIKYNLQCGWCA